MQRTQIYLPDDLRKEVDKYRSTKGQSLAEYTRKSLEDSIEKEKTEKEYLKKLADGFIGSLKMTDQEVQEWLEEIREERRLSDEVREERLQKALVKKSTRK